ncbi:clip-associating protein [Stylonychia lemnae]|uniref:Clip-associating protein n=1 Tax=Stylonychia lemnae TaxID=5949 RepID=A0A078B954_STYLE|nr:clip-associating protein [Stylonychia lemnae]|eukprot:CDW90093.1 clip-associating protein [Stylonychia lemnae]
MNSKKTTDSKSNQNKKNFKHNLSKKTDAENPDEESQNFIEKQAMKDNDNRVDILEKQVSAIKGISMGLSTQIKDDVNLIKKLDTGFDKTKLMVTRTLGKLDEMVTKGSNSVFKIQFVQSMANKSIISNSTGMNPLVFDSQINRISETLKDTQKNATKGGNEAQIQDFLDQIFKRLQKPIQFQILDLRSTVMKEACQLLIFFSNQYPKDFENHSHRYIHEDCLFKALNNGKKVVVDLAHDCIKQILKSTQNQKVIQSIGEQLKSSRNTIFKAKLQEYFASIITTYPQEILLRNQDCIEIFIQDGLSDPNDQVRLKCRQVFAEYQKIFPEQADILFSSLDITYQKAILNQQPAGANDDSNYQSNSVTKSNKYEGIIAASNTRGEVSSPRQGGRLSLQSMDPSPYINKLRATSTLRNQNQRTRTAEQSPDARQVIQHNFTASQSQSKSINRPYTSPMNSKLAARQAALNDSINIPLQKQHASPRPTNMFRASASRQISNTRDIQLTSEKEEETKKIIFRKNTYNANKNLASSYSNPNLQSPISEKKQKEILNIATKLKHLNKSKFNQNESIDERHTESNKKNTGSQNTIAFKKKNANGEDQMKQQVKEAYHNMSPAQPQVSRHLMKLKNKSLNSSIQRRQSQTQTTGLKHQNSKTSLQLQNVQIEDDGSQYQTLDPEQQVLEEECRPLQINMEQISPRFVNEDDGQISLTIRNEPDNQQLIQQIIQNQPDVQFDDHHRSILDDDRFNQLQETIPSGRLEIKEKVSSNTLDVQQMRDVEKVLSGIVSNDSSFVQQNKRTKDSGNKEKQIQELLVKCQSTLEVERFSAYSHIADIYSLDSSDNMEDEDGDLPPIKCFAAIVEQLIKGMEDESKEIKITVMETIGNIVIFFKDTIMQVIPQIIEKIILNLSNNSQVEACHQLFNDLLQSYQEEQLMIALIKGVKSTVRNSQAAFMISAFELISNIIKKIQISKKANGFDCLIQQAGAIEFLLTTILLHHQLNSSSVLRLSKAVLELLYCTGKNAFEAQLEKISETQLALLQDILTMFIIGTNFDEQRQSIQDIVLMIKSIVKEQELKSMVQMNSMSMQQSEAGASPRDMNREDKKRFASHGKPRSSMKKKYQQSLKSPESMMISSIQSNKSSIGSPKVQFSFDIREDNDTKVLRNQDYPLQKTLMSNDSQLKEVEVKIESIQLEQASSIKKDKQQENEISLQNADQQLDEITVIQMNEEIKKEYEEYKDYEIVEAQIKNQDEKLQNQPPFTLSTQADLKDPKEMPLQMSDTLNSLDQIDIQQPEILQQEVSKKTEKKKSIVEKQKSFIEELKLQLANPAIVLKALKDKNSANAKNTRFWEKHASEIIQWLVQSTNEDKIKVEYGLQMILDLMESQTQKKIHELIRTQLSLIISTYYLNEALMDRQKPRLLYLMQRVAFHFNFKFFLIDFVNGFKPENSVSLNQFVLDCMTLVLDSTTFKPDLKFLSGIINKLLLKEINNPEALIRKSVIECLVAVKQLMGTSEFDKDINGRLNETQEQLIVIYYQRRGDKFEVMGNSGHAKSAPRKSIASTKNKKL